MTPTYTVTRTNPTGRKEIVYETGPDGTAFHAETPEAVRDVLRLYMGRGIRLRVHYATTETGADWRDLYDAEGRIGRSTGSIKVPLLCNNARSMGGALILDHCIVRIRFANRQAGGDLYRHPTYNVDKADVLRDCQNDGEAVWVRHFA